ncbi:MAG: peptide deformylase [Patescibacteria group bacterium]
MTTGPHQLVPSDDPVLRKVASRAKDARQVADLAEALLTSMRQEGGVGMAAPQVGQSVRVFVTGVGEQQVFVNPEITERSDELIWWEEGCLSLPRLLGDVRRPKEVTIRAIDAQGTPFTVRADGLCARVIQHEIDHLDGILFPDRMEDLSKLRTLTDKEWQSRFEGNEQLREEEM